MRQCKPIGFQMIPITKNLYAQVQFNGDEAQDEVDEVYPVIAVAMVAYDPGIDTEGHDMDWDIDFTDRLYLLGMPAGEDAAWVEPRYIKGFFEKMEHSFLVDN